MESKQIFKELILIITNTWLKHLCKYTKAKARLLTKISTMKAEFSTYDFFYNLLFNPDSDFS